METANTRIAQLEAHIMPKHSETTETHSPFVYTVEGSGSLSIEQRLFYEENGYIIVRGLHTKEEIAAYNKRFVEICRDPTQRPPGLNITRDIATVKAGNRGNDEKHIHKIQDWMFDEELFTYARHEKQAEVLKSICGPDVKCIQTMLLNKPNGVGPTTRHPLHQDLLYFPVRPYNTVCASWTAMVPVNRENGCLVAIPGSHRLEQLFNHEYPKWENEGGVNKFYFGIQNIPKELPPKVYLEMDIGDTVFFHPLLIHGSGSNKSDHYRAAISCHFSSARNHYVGSKDMNHEAFEKEMGETFQKVVKKMGENFSFIDYFKLYKVRLIAGKEYEDRL